MVNSYPFILHSSYIDIHKVLHGVLHTEAHDNINGLEKQKSKRVTVTCDTIGPCFDIIMTNLFLTVSLCVASSINATTSLDIRSLLGTFAISGVKTRRFKVRGGALRISWDQPTRINAILGSRRGHALSSSSGREGAISAVAYHLTETCRFSVSRPN